MSSQASGGGGGGSRKLLLGIAGASAAAGLLYYAYYKSSTDAKKRQEELNKLFESGAIYDDDPEDEDRRRVEAAREQAMRAPSAQDGQENPNGVSIEIVIPSAYATDFIGKNGGNVKKLQAETNTRIFSKGTLENGDRVYKIHGLANDISLAEHQIKRYISMQPVQISKEIFVPNEYVGSVIGAKGESIKSIQDRSKAKVIVDPQQDAEIAFFAPSTSVKNSTPIIIRGTEDQIKVAKEFIEEIVNKRIKLDETRKISASDSDRTSRRVLKPVASGGTTVVSPTSTRVISSPETEKLNMKSDQTFKIYVSCVYDPNCFYIQICNDGGGTKLNLLTEEMTEYYDYRKNKAVPPQEFRVGDIVAVPFDNDKKIYRAQIVEVMKNDEIRVRYVDYGDRRTLKAKDLRSLNSEFLRLRFQALEATMNLEVPKKGWTDEIVDEFCRLTYAGNWTPLNAKRVEYLDDPNIDKICVELFEIRKKTTINIKEELVNFMKELEIKANISGTDSAISEQVSKGSAETVAKTPDSVNSTSASHNLASATSPENATNISFDPKETVDDSDSVLILENVSPSSPPTLNTSTSASSGISEISKPTGSEATSNGSSASTPGDSSSSTTTSTSGFSYAAMARKH